MDIDSEKGTAPFSCCLPIYRRARCMASGRSMHGTQSRRRRRPNGWGSGAGASTRRCCRASSRRSGRTRSESRQSPEKDDMVSGTLLGELGPPFRCQQSNIVRSTQGGCSFGRGTVTCGQLNNFVQFDRFFYFDCAVPSTSQRVAVGPQRPRPRGPLKTTCHRLKKTLGRKL
jgi:hypothetical protein